MTETTPEMPKSYLSDAEREGLSPENRYIRESIAAGRAGDEDTSWAWIRLIELPALALRSLRARAGVDFVRSVGLADQAEKTLGKNWQQI
ncbi:hypothetical protein AGMMS50225_26820 [Betaproteobacteria bacterium]|nr:hypothetical protein AGMMS50225_26820 [Betaproteobacteria bacterium]